MWGAHLLMLVCLAAAAGLGAWQYHAWQLHREAERRDITGAAPVPLADVLGPDDPFPGDQVGRPVVVRGTWLPEGTVLVSGREDDAGHDGLWVVTPLTSGGPDAPAIPVVRGWVPDGTTAADLERPRGTAEVTGWLQPPEGTGAVDADPSDDVLPQLRTADLVQRVDQDLYGAYVVAEDPAPGTDPATLDQLPDAGTFTGLRNLLYALEWWVFAGFAVFLWWRHVREVTAEVGPGDAGAGVPEDDDVASGA